LRAWLFFVSQGLFGRVANEADLPIYSSCRL
jgi:hypothetical protein